MIHTNLQCPAIIPKRSSSKLPGQTEDCGQSSTAQPLERPSSPQPGGGSPAAAQTLQSTAAPSAQLLQLLQQIGSVVPAGYAQVMSALCLTPWATGGALHQHALPTAAIKSPYHRLPCSLKRKLIIKSVWHIHFAMRRTWLWPDRALQSVVSGMKLEPRSFFSEGLAHLLFGSPY